MKKEMTQLWLDKLSVELGGLCKTDRCEGCGLSETLDSEKVKAAMASMSQRRSRYAYTVYLAAGQNCQVEQQYLDGVGSNGLTTTG